MNAKSERKGYMDQKKYLEAVDTVCMECAFQEETCETCPVRKTVDQVKEMTEAAEKESAIRRAMLEGMFK